MNLWTLLIFLWFGFDGIVTILKGTFDPDASLWLIPLGLIIVVLVILAWTNSIIFITLG